jgi:DNA-binding Lrp family transcriptional regulator
VRASSSASRCGWLLRLTTIVIEGGHMAAVLKALRGVPAVTAAHTTNGRWDLVAELETTDLPSFSTALDAIRDIDGVSATETSLLLKTVRF